MPAKGLTNTVSYYLGVDIGTTFTAVGVNRSGRTEVASLGDHGWSVPSVVYIGPDQQVLIGDAALRRAVTDPRRCAREFKRRIGDPVPIIIGGAPVSAELLTSMVLGSIVRQVRDLEAGPPDHIVITHPANWGPYKIDCLWQAVRLAEVDQLCSVSLMTEPEAAAAHYAATGRLEPGQVIAVYDLGGGTFDTAVLRRTEEGWNFLAPADGIERLGGIDFDQAVLSFIDAAVAGRVAALDPDDASSMAAVQQLRLDCVAAKEALSSDVDVTVRVLLPTHHQDVRLTRAEFEAMVEPSIYVSVESLQRGLRAAGVSPGDLRTVLLVGGSSRIPLVGELVSRILEVPVAVDAHPKNSVALGAALTAGVRAGISSAGVMADTPVQGAGSSVTTHRKRLLLVSASAVTVVLAVMLLFRPWGSTPRENLSAPLTPATGGPTSPGTTSLTVTGQPTSGGTAGLVESSDPEVAPEAVIVAVSSTVPWTDTGVDCEQGQDLVISATGTVLHDSPRQESAVGPDGLADPAFHQYNVPGLPNANTVGLIGSLDQSQPFFVVGSNRTYECQRAGRLFLGVNDAGLANNSGEFEASITIQH